MSRQFLKWVSRISFWTVVVSWLIRGLLYLRNHMFNTTEDFIFHTLYIIALLVYSLAKLRIRTLSK